MAGMFDDLIPDKATASGGGLTFDDLIPRKKLSASDHVAGFMANVNRGSGVGDEIAGAVRAGINVATGKSPVNLFSIGRAAASYASGHPGEGNLYLNDSGLPQAFGQAMSQQRKTEDHYAIDRPRAAALGMGVGMAATAFAPGVEAMAPLEQSTRAVNMARGATAAGLTAAGYAAVDRGSPTERLQAASAAARDPIVLGLGAAGGAMVPSRAKARKPAISEDVALLNKEGVQLTPGQMRGGTLRGAEDAGTSLPFVGNAIADRRAEGIQTFNRAVVNRALKPIGKSLPSDIQTGTDAVKYAGDLLSAGYENAIPGKVIRADPGFADDVQRAFVGADTLTPASRKRLTTILDQRVTSRLPADGSMDGRLYKKIQSELDSEVARFSKATDPDHRAIGGVIEGVQAAIENAAKRQDPQFASRIASLDRGWAELGRIETAAAKSTDLSGVFTPKQYAEAIRSGDTRVRNRGVARGEALSQDLARAGARVLPSQMPDSGTAGRSFWGAVATTPGAVIGAITGGGLGAASGIAGTGATLAAASRIYTPEAVQAANRALTAKVASQAQKQAVADLARVAATNPQAAKLYRAVLARLSRAAGVGGAARKAASSQASDQAAANLFARP